MIFLVIISCAKGRKMDYLIREAEISDAKAIHDIYGYYVENTYVTFSEENPSVGEYEE